MDATPHEEEETLGSMACHATENVVSFTRTGLQNLLNPCDGNKVTAEIGVNVEGQKFSAAPETHVETTESADLESAEKQEDSP